MLIPLSKIVENQIELITAQLLQQEIFYRTAISMMLADKRLAQEAETHKQKIEILFQQLKNARELLEEIKENKYTL